MIFSRGSRGIKFVLKLWWFKSDQPDIVFELNRKIVMKFIHRQKRQQKTLIPLFVWSSNGQPMVLRRHNDFVNSEFTLEEYLFLDTNSNKRSMKKYFTVKKKQTKKKQLPFDYYYYYFFILLSEKVIIDSMAGIRLIATECISAARGDYLDQSLLGMCRWSLRTPTPL